MSDPRNVAHDKKVTEEKKHHGVTAADDAPAAQPGKKAAAAKKKHDPASIAADPDASAPGEGDDTSAPVAAATPADLEASLVVLGQLKELEFHSRAALERLAALGLTVEDELKQKTFVEPLSDVYSAQNAFQTKLTALIDAYKAETDRMQGAGS